MRTTGEWIAGYFEGNLPKPRGVSDFMKAGLPMPEQGQEDWEEFAAACRIARIEKQQAKLPFKRRGIKPADHCCEICGAPLIGSRPNMRLCGFACKTVAMKDRKSA